MYLIVCAPTKTTKDKLFPISHKNKKVNAKQKRNPVNGFKPYEKLIIELDCFAQYLKVRINK